MKQGLFNLLLLIVGVLILGDVETASIMNVNIGTDNAKDVIFTIDGRGINVIQRSVNLFGKSDGSVRKIIMK